ncbi:MAG: polyamine aminopropyltransferase [Armatimonadota bacterium]|nr:polyamine aminopropyltransferase [Armatimonadota bacterium]MDR7402450.1 polyamine aminopropyltransferase [Armatimonadota bacterium]MDR7403773.1 polyamine aminopropyltransferase [Armatimonadota bacterium]MDR7437898.1 polyamine aminopropyltransferase [Armatimonadota bacterium]MDR7472123.1 polyamine aminopropyltransferase [Armatimonadota bacterium]
MEWLVDLVGPGVAQAVQITDVLCAVRSPYQRILIASSPLFGRMLILDDAVQTTERDEHTYHEMLAHLPLVTHPSPRRVLIIGGGDGGTLKEVLKHPVEHVTLVEIDAVVVEMCRRHLPSIGGEAFSDPRAEVVIDDGVNYVARAGGSFDVILVDAPDPKGPGLALFSPQFYAGCARLLTPQGILVAQSGSLLYQRPVTDMVRRHLREVFPVVGTYWVPVPSYPGVLWTFTYGSRRPDPRAVPPDVIAGRLAGVSTRLYSPAVHAAALSLPALTD